MTVISTLYTIFSLNWPMSQFYVHNLANLYILFPSEPNPDCKEENITVTTLTLQFIPSCFWRHSKDCWINDAYCCKGRNYRLISFFAAVWKTITVAINSYGYWSPLIYDWIGSTFLSSLDHIDKLQYNECSHVNIVRKIKDHFH